MSRVEKTFVNEKGKSQLYKRDSRLKKILNYALSGSTNPNNNGSNSYYWANGYCDGFKDDWYEGGWYSYPSEPNGLFPNIIVDIKEKTVYRKVYLRNESKN